MRLLHDPAYKLPRARCPVLPRFAVVRFSFVRNLAIMYSETPPSAPGPGSSSVGFGGATVTQERGSDTLQPTFTGHSRHHDALVLFEACLSGHLNHVSKRPHDRERNSLIRSGCIFIYIENESSIKRWTDGVN
jgi:hypothetical protein